LHASSTGVVGLVSPVVLRSRLVGHRFRFSSDGATMRWTCQHGCGAGGEKQYPTIAQARHADLRVTLLGATQQRLLRPIGLAHDEPPAVRSGADPIGLSVEAAAVVNVRGAAIHSPAKKASGAANAAASVISSRGRDSRRW
jgi:hypothetical protein